MNAATEGGDSLSGGVHIGGLGVVVELDAVARGNVLQAMLDGLKLLDGRANYTGRHASLTRGNHRGQHILHVVRALKWNSAQRHYLFRGRIFSGAVDYIPLFEPGSLRDGMLNREPENPGHRARGGFFAGGVVGVQHQAVLEGLRGKDALFNRAIVFKAAMTVQVVGGDVENDGDGGMELLGGFELEAGDLKDRPGFVGAGVEQGHDRDADVAANQRGQPGSRKDFAQQRGGGGLAIGAGDGERLALEEARGQFQFANDRQTEALDLRQFRSVQRHAGADDNQVLSAEGEQAVAAGLDHNARLNQGRNLLGQRLGRAHVGDRDLRATAAQKQRCRQTGFSQSDDQNFFTFEFQHRVLSSGFLYFALRGAGLTQFQRGECKQCKHQGTDPEADDGLGFTPAHLLEVVMEGGHLEDSLLVTQLVTADLKNDGDRFEDEDAANEGQQHLLADDDSNRTDGPAQGQRTHVAHKDFRRVGVVPEEADGGAHHGAAENGQLGHFRHVLEFKVVGKNHGAADVGEHGQGAAGDDVAADGQPIQSVGQVNGVGRTDQHEDDKSDKGQKGQQAQVGDGAGPRVPQQVGTPALDERHGQLRGEELELIQNHQRNRHCCPSQPLP